MPELPEVEIARRNLARWTQRRVVVAADAPWPGVVAQGHLDDLAGATIVCWERRAKYLIAHLDGARAAHLVAHLGMTGQWLRDPGARPYQCAVLRFDDGGEPAAVALAAPRRLARVWVLGPGELATHTRIAGLGPDAWPAIDGAWLRARVGDERPTPLKSRLLDQSRVGGLGNIAVVEACFRARLHPHTPVDRLTPADWDHLAAAIIDHIDDVLADEEGDEIAYVNLGGDNPFAVYDREGERCPRCAVTGDTPAQGGPPHIVRTVLAGRSSWACPACQPLAGRRSPATPTGGPS